MDAKIGVDTAFDESGKGSENLERKKDDQFTEDRAALLAAVHRVVLPLQLLQEAAGSGFPGVRAAENSTCFCLPTPGPNLFFFASVPTTVFLSSPPRQGGQPPLGTLASCGVC